VRHFSRKRRRRGRSHKLKVVLQTNVHRQDVVLHHIRKTKQGQSSRENNKKGKRTRHTVHGTYGVSDCMSKRLNKWGE